MRVFKAQYKDKSGETRKSKKWYIDFVDHIQTRHRIPGFENKRQTEALGRQIEDLVSTKAAGQRPDTEQQRWLGTLSESLLKKFCQWGLLQHHRVQGSKSITQQLDEWKQSIVDEGSTKNHAIQQLNRASSIFKACGFNTLMEIVASKLQYEIGRLKNNKTSAPTSNKTKNYYLQACKQFTRWAFMDRRISENPLEHLKPIKADSADRCSLELDEVRWLLETTESAPKRFCMSGHERCLLYRLAIETGLRAAELRSLMVTSFDFDDNTVTVENRSTKNRKGAYLPLKADTAKLIREIAGLKLPQAKIFNLPSKYRMADMIRADLRQARTEWLSEVEHEPVEYKVRSKSEFLVGERESGNIDFHCLRHTFGTMLAASGVHPKTAQELMRHSDINLTMSRYTHTLTGQTAKAIETLPDLTKSARTEKSVMTGTDNRPADAVSKTKQIKPDNRLAICLAKLGTENRSQPESTGIIEALQTSHKTASESRKGDFSLKNQIRPPRLEHGTYGLEIRSRGFVSTCK
jgi:integrase